MARPEEIESQANIFELLFLLRFPFSRAFLLPVRIRVLKQITVAFALSHPRCLVRILAGLRNARNRAPSTMRAILIRASCAHVCVLRVLKQFSVGACEWACRYYIYVNFGFIGVHSETVSRDLLEDIS